MNKQLKKLAALFMIGFFTAPLFVYGGPLDRDPMQERYNPAAKDMLRVPGVVGSYEQEALGSLQQAGLSVSIKRIKIGRAHV